VHVPGIVSPEVRVDDNAVHVRLRRKSWSNSLATGSRQGRAQARPCSWSITTTSAPAAASAWVATGEGMRLRKPASGTFSVRERSLTLRVLALVEQVDDDEPLVVAGDLRAEGHMRVATGQKATVALVLAGGRRARAPRRNADPARQRRRVADPNPPPAQRQDSPAGAGSRSGHHQVSDHAKQGLGVSGGWPCPSSRCRR
jgi:hypothetical protein